MVYKVLVVDDEEPVRDMFSDLLEKEKCLVRCASSGEESLEILKQEDFDVALLDIQLSGISGLETLKRIKEVKPHLTVIMITGFGYDENLVTQSKKLGCDGYIGKNMPISQIINNFRLFTRVAQEKKIK